MEKILIIGAGQYGQVVAEIAKDNGFDYEFVDDNSYLAKFKISDLDYLKKFFNKIAIAIGDPKIRERISIEIKLKGYSLLTLVHSKAFVSKSATLGDGCIVEAMASINSNVEIGKCCLICMGALINHNAKIEDYCQIDIGAVLQSREIIKKGTKVGINHVQKVF